MAKAKVETKQADFEELRLTAHELARQEYDKVDGDRTLALSALMQIIETKPDVAEALQLVAYDRLWRQYLWLCSKNQRERIVNEVRNEENVEPWKVPDNLGDGLTAKRQNMDTIYDYQFPFLSKGIGLAVKNEFFTAVEKVKARAETDRKLVGLGEAISKRIAKAEADTTIQDIVPAGELARLFRQSGVTT